MQEVTIICDISNYCAKETLALLKKLRYNRQLRKLFLEPINSAFECEDGTKCTKALISSFISIIKKSNRLEALSLGCMEDLTGSARQIVVHLRNYQAKHLTTLALASVKDDPDDFNVYNSGYGYLFDSFARLCILTLDYEFLTNALLKALDSGTMERLVIHVHGWHYQFSGTTDSGWQSFVQKK